MKAFTDIERVLVLTQPSVPERRVASHSLLRIQKALHYLTVDHGTQCKCPGCEVLREGT